jgi:hypothetical protein
LEQLSSLAGGVADAFNKGSDLLAKMTGVRLSESTVQRTTEAVGERIAAKLEAGKTFGAKKPWEWYRDAMGRTVGYLGLDATGVPQQGPGGCEADHRMAYVGMVYNPLPDRERVFEHLPKPGATMQARYVSGLYSLEKMGPLLRRQAGQVGLDDVEVWIALTDGGNGLESFMETNFPQVEAVIIDYWHASQYVAKLATALHPNEGVEAAAQGRGRLDVVGCVGGSGVAEAACRLPRDSGRGTGLLPQSGASHGISRVRGERLVHRVRCRGERLQDGRLQSPQGRGYALERTRRSCGLPGPCFIPKRTGPVGILLATGVLRACVQQLM